MSNTVSEGVNTSETIDETETLNGQDLAYANSARNSPSSPITSQECAQKSRVLTSPLTKHLFCKPLKKLRQVPFRLNEEASGWIQGWLRGANWTSDSFQIIWTGSRLVKKLFVENSCLYFFLPYPPPLF